jgi:hypothetical protein
MSALENGQRSLPEAAVLCECDDAAATALLAVADGPMFDRRIARLGLDRQTEPARAEAETSCAEGGFTVPSEHPAWRDTTRVRLRYLRIGADGVASSQPGAYHQLHLMEEHQRHHHQPSRGRRQQYAGQG